MERTILAEITLTEEQLTGKTFYVIETFPYPQFVMDEDGLNKTFDTYDEALAEAEDCQQGCVAIF